MRLTLRTLLAYLDSTLEADDSAILQQKIEESTFATSLVARIRATMDHRELGAVAPDAVGPLENANVVSEYLDSTLGPEQIAEIERFCLESDVSLAEVAACHQILSVALREPTRVPETLRQRIHQLPASDQLRKLSAGQTTEISSPHSYASVEIPSDESPSDKIPAESLSTIQLDTSASIGRLSGIAPVGPQDSGVTKAPTRLREATRNESERDNRAYAVSAVRAAQQRGESFGGLVRPSRITPWLVSLGLAAVFLLAIGQLFQPLLQRRQSSQVAEVDQVVAPEINTDTVVPDANDETEPAAPNGPIEPMSPAEPDDPVESSEPVGPSDPDDANEPDEANEPVEGSEALETSEPDETSDSGASVSPKRVDDPSMDPSPVEPVAAIPPPVEVPAEELNEVKPAIEGGPAIDVMEEESPANVTPETVETDAADSGTGAPTATLVGRSSFLMTRNGENWAALTLPAEAEEGAVEPVKAPEVASNQTLLAPPLYRPVLVNEAKKLEWTIVGPASWKVIENADGSISTRLFHGRILLASTGDDAAAVLELGDRRILVEMPVAQTVIAMEVTHVRGPGMNPLIEQNRRLASRILSIQGQTKLKPSATDATPAGESKTVITLKEKDQWLAMGNQSASVESVDRLPDWIDAPEKQEMLVVTARDGVMDFVRKGKSLELALMEAMQFRRAEVVALAAETLLLLGRADAYFGIDGILSSSRQRLYWTEHFQQLRNQINIGAEEAEQVRLAVMNAELADGDAIFKLIVGFSNEELAAGGDAELVAMLNSNSMSVRVLAIENLRSIIGDTLGYRADEENAIRRAPNIKKWEARLRKGDIRYKEPA